MGSKKHKKHSKGRDDDGAPLSSEHAPPIKLVLKVGNGGASPSPGPASMVSYSSTVSAPTTFQPSAQLNPPGISLRLNVDSAESAVKKLENPLLNGSVASDSPSESSHHKHKKSEKKKKKKKKHHHHHCHHHHKHHHSSQHGEKRKDRPEDEEDDDEEDDRPPKKQRHPVTESVDNQHPLPDVPLRSPVGFPQKASTELPALQKLLDVLLRLLQKKDVYDFFAWPVNDAIAPGYSMIIANPMDFSTIRRKLDNRQYRNLETFRADVRLICDNATTYNRPETIYFKEAKKLWRNAQKIISKENILSLDPELKSTGALTVEDLGFDLRSKSPIEELAPRMTRNRYRTDDDVPNVVPPMRISLAANVVEHCIAAAQPVARMDGRIAAVESSTLEEKMESPVIERMHPDSIARRFDVVDTTSQRLAVQAEPIAEESSRGPVRTPSPGLARKSRPDETVIENRPPADDADADEILEHAQRMARGAADRLAQLKPATNFAFLRQEDDGSTTLNILNPDITLTDKYPGPRPPKIPVTPRRVDLEMLIGKLPYGMSNLVDFKDDARSIAKPLNYLPMESGPPFATYAPHYDSTFSNMTKAESDLVYSTYGEEIGVQYAESIMHFAKDCDYVITMVDNILDTLTNGEHKKTLKTLKSGELLKEPEESEPVPTEKCNGDVGSTTVLNSTPNNISVVSSTSPSVIPPIRVTVVTPHQNGFAATNGSAAPTSTNGDQNNGTPHEPEALPPPKTAENEQKLQSKLAETTEMIERLTKLQKDRLSQPPPTHLGSVQGPSPAELELADKLAATLSELASHAKPGSIVSVDAIRRAMGITLPEKKAPS